MSLPQKRQRGAAVVEAAIALPVILVIILGTVEVCNNIFLKQSLSLMAFEGARVAIIPDATFEDIEQQVEEFAATRNIVIDSVVVDPEDFSSQPAGAVIEVQVTSSASQPGRTSLFTNGQRTVSVFIMKEQE